MQWFNHVFRMRHHADDVAGFVANARDVIHGTVGVLPLGITEDDATFIFELLQGFRITNIVALAMGHRAGDDVTLLHLVGEPCGVVVDDQINIATDEFQAGIAHQCTWQ